MVKITACEWMNGRLLQSVLGHCEGAKTYRTVPDSKFRVASLSRRSLNLLDMIIFQSHGA